MTNDNTNDTTTGAAPSHAPRDPWDQPEPMDDSELPPGCDIPNDPNDPFNLGHLDGEWAAAKAEREEKAFDPVPNGRYQVVVERAEMGLAKSSGNPMLRWTFRIVSGAHAGRKLFKNGMLIPDFIERTKQDLHTCGVDPASPREIPAMLPRLLDIALEVAVQNTEDKREKGKNNQNVYINRKLDIAVGGGGAAPAPAGDLVF